MHNNLDPDKIEDLLRNVPIIEDTRSKEDVFARLKAAGAFDEISEPNHEVVKPMKKSFPYFKIASFVALFALVIFIPILMINKDDSWIDTANDSDVPEMSSDKREMSESEDYAEETNNHSIEAYNESMVMMGTVDYRTGLYEDELVDGFVFHIGMVSNTAESVPISMKIPRSYLQEHGLSSNASYLQIYEYIAPLLDEEALGFSDYHPFVGRFEEQGDQLIHYLPDDHSYDLGSASILHYMSALNDTFGSHYKEVVLRKENGEMMEFSEVGKLNEPIALTGLDNRMNYFIVKQGSGPGYLSINTRDGYKSLDDAYVGLKNEWNEVYSTAMIDELNFEIEDRGTYTAVKFIQSLDLMLYDVNELVYMLEAIVATAASFGEQVKFENVIQEEFGGFSFTEVIPKLIGVNEISFPFQ